jgi:hypothetical protein
MEETVARLSGIMQKHLADDDLVEVEASKKFDLIELKIVFCWLMIIIGFRSIAQRHGQIVKDPKNMVHCRVDRRNIV